jgi:phosphoglycolate phosphatase-like HAD superfamily hydrolase
MNQLVIFDIDGTLVDSYGLDTECYADALKEFLGIPNIDTDWNIYTNVTDAGILTEIYISLYGSSPDSNLLSAFEITFSRRLEEGLKRGARLLEIPGAKTMIETLESMGVDIRIVTGGFRRTAWLKLKKIGLERLMLRSCTSSEFSTREDALLHACSDFQPIRHPSSAWYVGDGMWDMRSAHDQGIKFIGIGERLQFADNKFWIQDYTDLDKFLDMIFK